MTLIAISAAYGAAGSRIGPALAQRLRVPFVDRAIPLAVAERLDVAVAAANVFDERSPASLLQRMLVGFIGADTGVPAAPVPDLLSEEDFRTTTEQVLRAQASTGEGVILGRGAAFVLRDDPRALLVRLDGPPERRIEQAMRLQELDRETAANALSRIDRAHAAYVRQSYGVRIDDAAAYHLVLDSTWLEIDTCVELIAIAAEGRRDLSHPR
jgi:hypothetical protein